jgi:sulfate/thiosulfate transport system ATP-binding protein
MSVELKGINKTFGEVATIKDLDLAIPTGELVALLGPSGCGKTTLLRIIAGLESPDSGAVLFDGQSAASRSVRERRVGFVFQHYALFRHLTVFENIAFGLRVQRKRLGLSESNICLKVRTLVELVQMEHLAWHYPAQLSGGQRQRVALARSLAVEPRLLLLDEPFGALDNHVRRELRRWLRRLHDDLHVTSVFVTHDTEEALEVADRLVIMNEGRIEQIGTPEEIYDHPKNLFVYSFLGHTNSIARAPKPEASAEGNGEIAFVRPHDLIPVRDGSDPSSIAAQVKHVQFVGPVVHIELTTLTTAESVEAHVSRDDFATLGLQAGETVWLRARQVRVFAAPEPLPGRPPEFQAGSVRPRT